MNSTRRELIPPFTAWVSVDQAWADGLALSGVNRLSTGDPDGDMINNLVEFGLGGNSTNGADVGHLPTIGTVADNGTNWFEYIHPCGKTVRAV